MQSNENSQDYEAPNFSEAINNNRQVMSNEHLSSEGFRFNEKDLESGKTSTNRTQVTREMQVEDRTNRW